MANENAITKIQLKTKTSNPIISYLYVYAKTTALFSPTLICDEGEFSITPNSWARVSEKGPFSIVTLKAVNPDATLYYTYSEAQPTPVPPSASSDNIYRWTLGTGSLRVRKDRVLDNVTLDQGEPLVNTDDSTLILGGKGNTSTSAANNPTNIILGASKNEIIPVTNNSIDLVHKDSGVTRSIHNVNTKNAKLTYDPRSQAVEIDADYNLTVTAVTTPQGTSKATFHLTDSLGSEHSTVKIAGGSSTSITADGNTITISDTANVEDNDYKPVNSEYVAKVTQTGGQIAYTKHTIEGADNISVSTSSGKTTIKNTAELTDSAVDNKYVSEVDQEKGKITVSRRTILEDTQSETANNESTTTSNGHVEVITSAVPPADGAGIILKNRIIKGDKGIEVIVNKGTSYITVQQSDIIAEKTDHPDGFHNDIIENGGSFNISDFTYNAQGHVTDEGIVSVIMPRYIGRGGISIDAVPPVPNAPNDYIITNTLGVQNVFDPENSMTYISKIECEGNLIKPGCKVLTPGTGITITTGAGDIEDNEIKLTIGHSNSVQAQDSCNPIVIKEDGSVYTSILGYDAAGHITSLGETLFNGWAAGDNRLGMVKTGRQYHHDEMPLVLDSDGTAYVRLKDSAIISADGATTGAANTFKQTQTIDIDDADETTEALVVTTGQIRASTFNATSDARLKENFQPLTPEKSILDLPCYKFDFINGAKNQIGCKAQDLQEICPEIVNEGDDGYLSIQESKIVYLLLEEVKKLRKEIEEMKGNCNDAK